MAVSKKTFYTNCQVYGNNILYRGVKNGKRFSHKIRYKPSLFIPSNKKSEYKTIHGQNVDKITFDSILEARDFIEKYKDVENFTIFGNTYYQYCFLCDVFKNQIDYDINDIRIGNLDIEAFSLDTENTPAPVLAITLKIKDKFYVFGCQEFNPANPDIVYKKCKNETELLKEFVKFWSSDYVDIITGYNITNYDLPYLVNRITKVCGEFFAKKLSPWDRFSQRSVTLMGEVKQVLSISGIAILDYYELYKKFAPNNRQESYKLDYIAYVELGERKLSYEEYKSLVKLYEENFEKFMQYNIQDVNLVDKLDEKLHLIELALSIAYRSKVNFEEVFGKVKIWDNLLFDEMVKHKTVVPPRVEVDKETQYVGAYVKEPIPGFHRWVVSLDLNSLYPNLIRTFNISPETIREEYFKDVTIDDLLSHQVDTSFLTSKDLTMASNGHCFKREPEGFLPKMVRVLYEERVEYKNKMLESEKELQRVKEEIHRRKK